MFELKECGLVFIGPGEGSVVVDGGREISAKWDTHKAVTTNSDDGPSSQDKNFFC